MALELLLLLSVYLINNTLSCSYYAERHPEPPFHEIARYPLGICTGNHYSHTHIDQESVMYLCSHDNSHIIKYKYTSSSTCNGEYESSIATRNTNDFICDDSATCPYIVIKIYNQFISGPDDWRNWFTSSWITNHCNNGQLYSCHDNTGYTLNIFENEDCEGTPSDIIMYTTDEYDIYCNQPDPASAIIAIPDENGFNDNLESAIETAVCLNGRTSGQHLEIGDKMISYCFNGYDENKKPIYSGDVAEIRWTKSATSYGDSYGLFLPNQQWPIAYCFNDSPDISLCTKHWYVDHGKTARYYLDENMEMNECQCSVNMEYLQNQNVNDNAGEWHSIYIGIFVGFIVFICY